MLLDQDNASSHCACASTACFHRHVHETDWPADLSPIEHRNKKLQD